MRHSRPSSRLHDGFTLVEVMVSLAILGIISVTVLGSLTLLNREATVGRLLSAGQAVALSQIELCLTDTPFNPQLGQTPPELAIGTQTSASVPIYADQSTKDIVVSGTITTTVANAGLTVNGTDLNARTISVTVSFQYRGRPYTVTMNTMRCSDV